LLPFSYLSKKPAKSKLNKSPEMTGKNTFFIIKLFKDMISYLLLLQSWSKNNKVKKKDKSLVLTKLKDISSMKDSIDQALSFKPRCGISTRLQT